MTTQRLPRVTSAPSLEHTDCTTCGEEIPPDGATVWIVDPEGWSNVCCTADCADHERGALRDLNPDTDFLEAEHLLREHEELLKAAKAVDEYAPIVQDALDRSTRHEMNAGELGLIANVWDEMRTALHAAVAKAEGGN